MRKPFRPVLKRPRLHHLIIIVYIAAPFANLLLLRVFLGLPFSTIFARLAAGYGTLATIWLFSAPVVGICLYFVTRFSWYLFISHSCLILADFVLKWATRPTYYLETVPGFHNIMILTGNLALLAIVGTIIRRDFRSPYFQVLNRSWRERKRIPIHHPVSVDGLTALAEDLSALGCFVREPASQRAAGTRVQLRFASDTLAIECAGEIMRVTENGLGIRFIGLPIRKKRDIERMLRKRFSLRQKVDLPCVWTFDYDERTGAMQNLSSGGCYIQSATAGLKAGLSIALSMQLEDLARFQKLPGVVVWINNAGQDEKPIGFGLKFQRKQRRLMRYVTLRHGRGILVR